MNWNQNETACYGVATRSPPHWRQLPYDDRTFDAGKQDLLATELQDRRRLAVVAHTQFSAFEPKLVHDPRPS
jgi:hypothetical protein